MCDVRGAGVAACRRGTRSRGVLFIVLGKVLVHVGEVAEEELVLSARENAARRRTTPTIDIWAPQARRYEPVRSPQTPH